MTSASTHEKKKALLDLKASICSHRDWWLFPSEPLVQGFLGTGTIFIVGDQPSTDDWEINHPHRRAFYDLLAAEHAGDCHLTDLYKRRGRSGELRRNGIPSDFDQHLKIFFMEVKILCPSTILALGWDAYRLLLAHAPRLNNILERVWHFGTVRHGKSVEFQTKLRRAIIAARRRELRALHFRN